MTESRDSDAAVTSLLQNDGNDVTSITAQDCQQIRPIKPLNAGLHDLKIAHAMKAQKVVKPYPKIKHEGAKYVVVTFIFLFI